MQFVGDERDAAAGADEGQKGAEGIGFVFEARREACFLSGFANELVARGKVFFVEADEVIVGEFARLALLDDGSSS